MAVPATVGLLALAAPLGAHKGVTSRYEYYRDVLPILEAKCAGCHDDGGPAPMSLMTYDQAKPWGESIREQVLAEVMPPWFAASDSSTLAVQPRLSAKELDVLLTWVTGGTPSGAVVPSHREHRVRAERSGQPDMILQAPAPYTLPAGTSGGVYEFELPTRLTEARWVTAVEVRPSNRSMARWATVEADGVVLGRWIAGEPVVPAPDGAAFYLTAASRLRVRVSYRKNWKEESVATTDSPAVLLTFSGRRALRPVRGLAIEPHLSANHGPAVGATLDGPGDVLAISVEVEHPYSTIAVDAVLADQQRMPLVRLREVSPGWPRRYWLARPVALPPGTRIDVTALRKGTTPENPVDHGVRVVVDYVAM